MIQKLGLYLSATPDLRILTKSAQKLSQLQAALQDTVPELASIASVSSLQKGILTIHAENGAAALKLKQLAPRLQKTLQELEPSISAIRIIVHFSGRRQTARRKKPNMSSQGLKILNDFSSRLEDTPLKTALERLISHQQTGPKTK